MWLHSSPRFELPGAESLDNLLLVTRSVSPGSTEDLVLYHGLVSMVLHCIIFKNGLIEHPLSRMTDGKNYGYSRRRNLGGET